MIHYQQAFWRHYPDSVSGEQLTSPDLGQSQQRTGCILSCIFRMLPVRTLSRLPCGQCLFIDQICLLKRPRPRWKDSIPKNSPFSQKFTPQPAQNSLFLVFSSTPSAKFLLIEKRTFFNIYILSINWSWAIAHTGNAKLCHYHCSFSTSSHSCSLLSNTFWACYGFIFRS